MMKSITHLFTQDIVIRRLRTVSGRKRAFQSTATVDGMIQNLSKEKAQMLGIIADRTFIGYFDIDTNILVGDIVVDRYSKRYEVKEVTKKDYGVNTHLECVLLDTNE